MITTIEPHASRTAIGAIGDEEGASIDGRFDGLHGRERQRAVNFTIDCGPVEVAGMAGEGSGLASVPV